MAKKKTSFIRSHISSISLSGWFQGLGIVCKKHPHDHFPVLTTCRLACNSPNLCKKIVETASVLFALTCTQPIAPRTVQYTILTDDNKYQRTMIYDLRQVLPPVRVGAICDDDVLETVTGRCTLLGNLLLICNLPDNDNDSE